MLRLAAASAVLCACVASLLLLAGRADGGLIRQLISENLAGPPEQRVAVRYEFDPDVAGRRRLEFEALHGVRGERLVERLGLGEDGRSEQRRRQQRARDQLRLSVEPRTEPPASHVTVHPSLAGVGGARPTLSYFTKAA